MREWFENWPHQAHASGETGRDESWGLLFREQARGGAGLEERSVSTYVIPLMELCY